jgi:HSP20 family molecular chaperone IbpA
MLQKQQYILEKLLEKQFEEKQKEVKSKTTAEGAKLEEQSNNKTTCSSGPFYFQKTRLHCIETDENVTILLDVSGFDANQLQINLDKHVILVFGKCQNKIGDTFVIRRCFALRKEVADEETLQANLEDGVLEVTVQKKPEAKAHFYQEKVSSGGRSPRQQQSDQGSYQRD